MLADRVRTFKQVHNVLTNGPDAHVYSGVAKLKLGNASPEANLDSLDDFTIAAHEIFGYIQYLGETLRVDVCD